MPRRRHRFPALAAAFALGLAGCGGSDDPTATGPASNPGASETAPQDQAGTKVTMKDIEYKPSELKVKVGETVTWVNEDTVEHDVAATSGDDLKSELFGKGKTYAYKTTKAGKIAYVCTVHPGMEGTLTVER